MADDIVDQNQGVLLRRLLGAGDATQFEKLDDATEVGITLADVIPRVVTAATSATLGRTHVGATVLSSSASAVTFTTPASTVLDTFPVGAYVDIIQTGAGKVQIAAGSGVTVSNDGAGLFFAAQQDKARLVRTSATTFHLSGTPLAAS